MHIVSHSKDDRNVCDILLAAFLVKYVLILFQHKNMLRCSGHIGRDHFKLLLRSLFIILFEIRPPLSKKSISNRKGMSGCKIYSSHLRSDASDLGMALIILQRDEYSLFPNLKICFGGFGLS